MQTTHTSLSSKRTTLTAKALFLGEAIDIQDFKKGSDRLALRPLAIRVGDEGGCAVLFPYGAVVVFGLSTLEEIAFLDRLAPKILDPFSEPETEEAELVLRSVSEDPTQDERLVLQDFTIERLQIVADIFAKSVVLSHYESRIATTFEQVEPFAASLQAEDHRRQQGKELLRQLGNSLLVQHKIVGRVEIIDKPELLWEAPELEQIYLRLEGEYEIRERHQALERKLALISRTAETVLEFMQHQTSLRVEWYVVFLIVVEIFLSLYDIFFMR